MVLYCRQWVWDTFRKMIPVMDVLVLAEKYLAQLQGAIQIFGLLSSFNRALLLEIATLSSDENEVQLNNIPFTLDLTWPSQ